MQHAISPFRSGNFTKSMGASSRMVGKKNVPRQLLRRRPVTEVAASGTVPILQRTSAKSSNNQLIFLFSITWVWTHEGSESVHARLRNARRDQAAPEVFYRRIE